MRNIERGHRMNPSGDLAIQRPKLSWVEFVESMPAGKAPAYKDVTDRWDTVETVELRTDRNDKTRVTGTMKRSREDGEQNALRAWLLGVMEPAEAEYFGMLTINVDRLVLLAVVPMMRTLAREATGLANNQTAFMKMLENVEAGMRQTAKAQGVAE